MRIKMGKRSLTFMIIPDANRKVIRFRISTFLLYIAPIAILSIICVSLYVHMENLRTTLEKERLATELADKKRQYEQTLTHKNQTIADLQSEIVDISEQTEDMKLKVNELKQLEEEIREVTAGDGAGRTSSNDNGMAVDGNFGMDDSQMIAMSAIEPYGIAAKGEVSISSISKMHIRSASGGMGGEASELMESDTSSLLDVTKRELSILDAEAGKLIASITSSRDALIEHIRQKRITPSIWPTVSTKISSKYGYRKDPFTKKAAFHGGTDISGNVGDPIYVTAEGIVTSVGYDRSYGYNVIVKHANGLKTRYGHLKKYTVKEGQLVEQGEKIGLLGSTGRSTGPHLHYEVIKGGVTIDPTPYMGVARGEDK